jgi:hypothetical protein
MTETENTAPPAALANFFKLLTDAPDCRRRLAVFQRKQDEAEAGEKSLMGAITAHEQHESEIRKDLARLQTDTARRRDDTEQEEARTGGERETIEAAELEWAGLGLPSELEGRA